MQQRRLLVGRGVDRIDGPGAEPLLHQRLEVARRAGRRRRLAQGRQAAQRPMLLELGRVDEQRLPADADAALERDAAVPGMGEQAEVVQVDAHRARQPTRRRSRLAAIAATATTITSSSTPIEVQASPEAPCAPPTVAAIATPTMPPVTMQRR